MATFPTIHLNGTSKESLLNGYRIALEKISDAISALQETAPHGRDYYVQSNNAIGQAIYEHRGRINALCAARSEIEDICIHIIES